jgi:hypothetical protein
MAAFWPVFTFGGSGPAHGLLDNKQEIQIQIQFAFDSLAAHIRFYSFYGSILGRIHIWGQPLVQHMVQWLLNRKFTF